MRSCYRVVSDTGCAIGVYIDKRISAAWLQNPQSQGKAHHIAAQNYAFRRDDRTVLRSCFSQPCDALQKNKSRGTTVELCFVSLSFKHISYKKNVRRTLSMFCLACEGLQGVVSVMCFHTFMLYSCTRLPLRYIYVTQGLRFNQGEVWSKYILNQVEGKDTVI